MEKYAYDRLSAQDNSFLIFDKPNAFTHAAGVQIFEAGPLRTADGGIDVEVIRKDVAARLHLVPRYRQKLKWIPFENHPVWVDDPHFNIDYHVRHTSLPKPGGAEELKRQTARILARRLDRARPLWEYWVIEGLEGGEQFALIFKIHHCMIDGASGADLMELLMSPDPLNQPPTPPAYVPRPAPTGRRLLLDEWAHRGRITVDAVRSVAPLAREIGELKREVETRVRALRDLLGPALRGPSDSPLNGRIGPHRRVDWTSMPLEEVKDVRRALGCSLNDVVLCIVTGAVSSFIELRGVTPASIDFRVGVPVSVRSEGDEALGNRVSQWIVELPLWERDPQKRLSFITQRTQHLKETNQAVAAEMLFGLAEWTGSRLLSLAARTRSSPIPINLMVTNIPGPQIPLYLRGAKSIAQYGMVPLLENTALGIALFSYDGRLDWGFSADFDLVPDLTRFIAEIEWSFSELKEVARAAASSRQP